MRSPAASPLLNTCVIRPSAAADLLGGKCLAFVTCLPSLVKAGAFHSCFLSCDSLCSFCPFSLGYLLFPPGFTGSLSGVLFTSLFCVSWALQAPSLLTIHLALFLVVFTQKFNGLSESTPFSCGSCFLKLLFLSCCRSVSNNFF